MPSTGVLRVLDASNSLERKYMGRELALVHASGGRLVGDKEVVC